MPRITIIVAIDLKNAIGKDNKLLCHLANDLKHFKSTTSGHTIIMGRKTFESLPNGALPNRRNIVLTHSLDFSAKNIELAHSLKEAVNMLKDDEIAFIIGGGSVYKESLSIADTMWITQIEHEFEGVDTYFPQINYDQWQKISTVEHKADDKNAYPHKITLYKKFNTNNTIWKKQN